MSAASWFDFTDPAAQHWSLRAMAIIVTAVHLYYFVPYAVHLSKLARNGVVYNEDDLVWAFQRWKVSVRVKDV